MAATAIVGMAILKPVVALTAWTMVMWLWMIITRSRAMSAAKLDIPNMVGGRGTDLEGKLPDEIMWIAHNHNHLHEAPTVFYAVALVLAITGHGDGLNATIGWAYVGLRVLHSIVQVSINRVIIRFAFYALSSLALIALLVHAVLAVF